MCEPVNGGELNISKVSKNIEYVVSSTRYVAISFRFARNMFSYRIVFTSKLINYLSFSFLFVSTKLTIQFFSPSLLRTYIYYFELTINIARISEKKYMVKVLTNNFLTNERTYAIVIFLTLSVCACMRVSVVACSEFRNLYITK